MTKIFLKISWFCLIITLVMFCVTLHAGYYEIVPSSEGNVLKIYEATAGRLSDEFGATIIREKYLHISITGEMLPVDFCVLSTRANKCKSIDLSNVKTNQVPSLAFGSAGEGDEVNIEKFVFPKNLQIIQHGTLNGCPRLKKVILPENLKTIESNCFEWCPRLFLDIPGTINIVGSSPFYASPHIHFSKTPPFAETVHKTWSLWTYFFSTANS